MKTFPAHRIATLSIALAMAACGGANVSEGAFDEPGADAAAGADTAGSGNTDTGNGSTTDSGVVPVEDAPPADTSPPVTSENVCTKLADAICTASLSACCGTKGIGYKDGGCRDAIMKDCADMQESVKAGRTTLNLDAFGACTAAWSALSTKCSTPLFDFLEAYAPCNQLFNGTTPYGGSCSEDHHCKVAAGAYASCNRDDRCEPVTVASVGAPCGVVSGSNAYCDYGAWCQYMSSSSGTCRAAKAIGASCNNSTECGFGNWCSRSGTSGSGNCAAGLPVGSACGFAQQCASWECVSGRCTDPNVSVASPGICNGSGG
jgi:hypothetical protein